MVYGNMLSQLLMSKSKCVETQGSHKAVEEKTAEQVVSFMCAMQTIRFFRMGRGMQTFYLQLN